MIRLITSGFWTSIQDMGRFGHRKQGIPSSGAMDHYSAAMANHLAGNAPTTPLIELTASGPKLVCEQACFMAVTAGFDLRIDGVLQGSGLKCYAPKGASIEFEPNGKGIRGYLAVRGGLKVPEVLGSYSQYQGITPAARLTKGDQLELAEPGQFAAARAFQDLSVLSGSNLKVFPGPEWARLDAYLQQAILGATWQVGPESNRMAYVMGSMDGISGFDIVTAPVQAGTVQLTPSGKLVVLMRDAQTTGGYARILQLDDPSIDHLAQRFPGEGIGFELCKF